MPSPVSDANQSTIGVTVLQAAIALFSGGLLAAIFYWLHRRRTSAIREMAQRVGFTYIGESLPSSVTLRGTALESIGSTWNVIQGERHKIRVISFDCRIGMGKSTWRRTVIAARTEADVFGAVEFSADLTVERSGDWIFLYEPRVASLIPSGLMSVDEIEAHLNGITPG